MNISIPTSMYLGTYYPCYQSEDDPTSGYNAWLGAPARSSSVEVPSYFAEVPRGKGNDLCHIKVTSVDVRTRGSDQIILTNDACIISGEKARIGFIRPLLTGDRGVYIRCQITTNNRSTSYWTMISVYSSSGSGTSLTRPYGYLSFEWVVKKDGSKLPQILADKGKCFDPTARDLIIARIPTLIDLSYLGTTVDYSLCRILLDASQNAMSGVSINKPTSSFKARELASCYATLPSGSLSDYLILDEWNLTQTGYSTKPYAAYHLQALRQDAYLDALDHVPLLNENSVSNVVELVHFIKSLVIDHKVEIPKSLSSAWLAYRYTYSTTKVDAEQAIDFVHRHVDDDFLRKGFSCYGSASRTLYGVDLVMKCRLDMKQKELSILDNIWTALYRYGLSPSFYMVWDLIPYSFIVDWFIPVGDILSGYDKTRMYDRTYDISNIWYSLQYITGESGNISAYTRWTSSSPPEFQGYYSFENKGTTRHKVIGYRILDTLSLIFR